MHLLNLLDKLNNINPLFIIGAFTIVCYLFNLNCIYILWTCAILYFLYYLYNKDKIEEGFTINKVKDTSEHESNKEHESKEDELKESNEDELKQISKTIQKEFHPITKKNPFGNVLLTDISDNPNRKAAAPCFNPTVQKDIIKKVKKQTQMLNSGIINTSQQLYGDLKDNYDLDISMQRFYSTANSRVDNDQGAFASWLYGSMPSSKESTPEGDIMRVKDNERYILI